MTKVTNFLNTFEETGDFLIALNEQEGSYISGKEFKS